MPCRLSTPLLLSLSALLFAACSGESEESSHDESASATTYYAEDFELPTHLGGTVRLSEALEKGPVILDFWATWCAPCRRAMPVYADLVEKYEDHGLQLLPVSLDTERAQSKIGPWFEERGFDFPSLLDPDRDVAEKFNVMNLPTTFLLDTDRSLVTWYVGFGPAEEDSLETEIRRILDLEAR